MSTLKTVRAAKISYIVMSVLFCVLGVVLLVTHEMSVSVLGVLVGAMLIAFGIVKLIGYFSRDLYRLAFQFDLALGIFLVVLGAIILLNPTRAMTFLCLMLGIAIMADGPGRAPLRPAFVGIDSGVCAAYRRHRRSAGGAPGGKRGHADDPLRAVGAV